MNQHNYFVYITTNPRRTTLYIGVTNNLVIRMQQHYENRGTNKSFAGKYYCRRLVYWERLQWIQHAIDREKELKKWRREKKVNLVGTINPNWDFLNEEIQD